MAEYKSFHYLMHKVPDQVKPHYIKTNKPKQLKFDELYSPRGDVPLCIGIKEKSFWRTGDSISFSFYEFRKYGVLLICCKDVSKNGRIYRTIIVSLEKLYILLERKLACGNADIIVSITNDSGEGEESEDFILSSKTAKRLKDDLSLSKAAIDFLLARLNIVKDPIPWPSQFESSLTSSNHDVSTLTLITSNVTPDSVQSTTSPDSNTSTSSCSGVYKDRMCSLDLLSGDTERVEIPFSYLENLLLGTSSGPTSSSMKTQIEPVTILGIDPSLLLLRPPILHEKPVVEISPNATTSGADTNPITSTSASSGTISSAQGQQIITTSSSPVTNTSKKSQIVPSEIITSQNNTNIAINGSRQKSTSNSAVVGNTNSSIKKSTTNATNTVTRITTNTKKVAPI